MEFGGGEIRRGWIGGAHVISVSSGFFGARSTRGIRGLRRIWDPRQDAVVWRFARLMLVKCRACVCRV